MASFGASSDDRTAPTDLMEVFENLKIVLTEAEQIELLRSLSKPERCTTIGFVNAHAINLCVEDPRFASCLSDCDVLFRDGSGVSIAMKMLGREPGLNMNGTDFIPVLMQQFRPGSISFFGSEEPWLSRAVEVFSKGSSNISVSLNGFLDDEDYVQALEDRQVNLVVLGMGMPKQERVAQKLKRAYRDRPMLIVCGGAILDFMSHRHQRAPDFVRRLGLEWMYRLYREPKRLFKRYIIGNPKFLIRVLRLLPRRSPA